MTDFRIHRSRHGFRIEQLGVDLLWHALPEIASEHYNDRYDVYKEPDEPMQDRGLGLVRERGEG